MRNTHVEAIEMWPNHGGEKEIRGPPTMMMKRAAATGMHDS